MNNPLILICSVDTEAEPVRRRMAAAAAVTIGRRAATTGTLAGAPVVLLVGGMGKTNAAQALTAALEAVQSRGVVGFGIAGAFAGTGLEPGDLALASEEIYGDEGVHTPSGWISSEAIGIPLLQRPRGGAIFNRFPIPADRVEHARRALTALRPQVAAGPFVTVSCCSGTAARGAELGRRFGAICETMEGAAYAHVAALYDAPFLEVRGVSNRIEDRDLSTWRIPRAAEAAAAAVERLTETWKG